jgi:hypothetical protein
VSYRFGKLQQAALSLMGLILASLTDSLDSLQPAIAMYSELLPSQYELSMVNLQFGSTNGPALIEGAARAAQV